MNDGVPDPLLRRIRKRVIGVQKQDRLDHHHKKQKNYRNHKHKLNHTLTAFPPGHLRRSRLSAVYRDHGPIDLMRAERVKVQVPPLQNGEAFKGRLKIRPGMSVLNE
jgi:hypothetical protein